MKNIKILDGNEAAAYCAYAFTEVAGIYPITPSSPMAEKTDEWAANGKTNIFGQPVHLVQMQSEAGAVGAVHGALETGALATSYTSSQGLLLMIPTLHRISGQRHPGVLHVASRTVGTHAFSIFGDHSDVMNCRQTGFAMLSSGSVQEIMDLGGIAHLAAIKGSVPFMHFFDGFRTSHEIQKVEAIDYEDFEKLLDEEAVEAFRKKGLNPEDPAMRSTVQNPDIYFQVREANNRGYDDLPIIVQDYMNEIAKITGRQYHLFDYVGDPEAEKVIIAMGSVSGTIKEVVKELNQRGEKVGFIQVYLYRPFSAKSFLKAIPKSCKKIAVLDRLKEIGALGEPLYEDVCTAFNGETYRPELYGGRYGLSSKDTDPTCIKAVFDNLSKDKPMNHFTVGIKDDVTNLSLPLEGSMVLQEQDAVCCKFWGLGSDGTVGANKNSIKIIGENTEQYCQAYFEYDTKKSFGVTKSHLRFGKSPILSTYLVKSADFVACHNEHYIQQYDIVSELKERGTFLLNCTWTVEQLEDKLSEEVKRTLFGKKINFYIMDANQEAKDLGLGNRPNIILQSAFFAIANIIPVEEAIKHMEKAVEKTYGNKGDDIVAMNKEAVHVGIKALKKVDIPASWGECKDSKEKERGKEPEVIQNILRPINALKGDDLPVSTFFNYQDGTMPLGTSAYEKRGIATDLPVWHGEECIQCNQCSLVCPHGVIRPFLLNEEETEEKPKGFQSEKAKGMTDLSYSIQVSQLDCTSCGSCVATCPKSEKALTFEKVEQVKGNREHWEYAINLSEKEAEQKLFSVKGSQFKQPLLEFSGACAGCGETPYIKLLTQLFGDKMYIANGTGCTQAWGAAMPCMPYTKTKSGKGPAWSNSLFENNAEFSYGMCLSVAYQREDVRRNIESIEKIIPQTSDLYQGIQQWKETYMDLDQSAIASEHLVSLLENTHVEEKTQKLITTILKKKNHLAKKTMWMVGGDGWAYDIGYGGLDHVFAMGENVNVLVVDTEVYSNTGGQSSKATPIGAVAQFQASGKKSKKKDLGMLMMTYDNVYVAQCALGANANQLLKALKEAEEHKGPSIVTVYAPCIAHGLKNGMNNVQQEMKDAVEAGYWTLYRWNPETQVFHLDSKEPKGDFKKFLRGEVRYASLEKAFPENAEGLFNEAEQDAQNKYDKLKTLASNFKGGKQ